MWREFTREAPARRGLAIAASGLAFAGTLGVAWVVGLSRSSATAVQDRQSPPDWPIAFRLPADFAWSRVPDPSGVQSREDGSSGQVSYVGRSLALGRCVAIVSFQVMPEGTPVGEAASHVVGDGLGLQNARPIAMGPLTGHMVVLPAGGGQVEMIAFACREDGLGVAVAFSTTARSNRREQIFQSICRSITFQD